MNNTSIQQALKNTKRLLEEQYNESICLSANDVNPVLEAEILLAHTLGKSRTFLHTYPEIPLNKTVLNRLDQYLERRIKGEPIAYITGYREFWSIQLLVNKNTLVPRAETELLVELALEKIPQKKLGRMNLLFFVRKYSIDVHKLIWVS